MLYIALLLIVVVIIGIYFFSHIKGIVQRKKYLRTGIIICDECSGTGKIPDGEKCPVCGGFGRVHRDLGGHITKCSGSFVDGYNAALDGNLIEECPFLKWNKEGWRKGWSEGNKEYMKLR